MPFPQDPTAKPLPDGDELQKLYAIALQKAGLWPSHLFAALDSRSMVGKGLLICVVDARGALDSDARLQTPVATDPLLAPLCKGLRNNCLAQECAKAFQKHLPRKAAASYQFVPTDLWKGGLEKDMTGLRVPRQSLKSRNAIAKLVWFIFPSDQEKGQQAEERVIRVAVLETLLLRPGATLPRHFVSELRFEDKAAMWEQLSRKHLNPGACIAVIFGGMGLDSEALREEPAFHDFQNAFLQHLIRWFDREDSEKAVLMEVWCPTADVVLKEAGEFTDYLNDFFDDTMPLWSSSARLLAWNARWKPLVRRLNILDKTTSARIAIPRSSTVNLHPLAAHAANLCPAMATCAIASRASCPNPNQQKCPPLPLPRQALHKIQLRAIAAARTSKQTSTRQLCTGKPRNIQGLSGQAPLPPTQPLQLPGASQPAQSPQQKRAQGMDARSAKRKQTPPWPACEKLFCIANATLPIWKRARRLPDALSLPPVAVAAEVGAMSPKPMESSPGFWRRASCCLKTTKRERQSTRPEILRLQKGPQAICQ